MDNNIEPINKPNSDNDIDIEVVRKLVPRGARSVITQEYLDKVISMVKDDDIKDAFKENFITHLNVLGDSKRSLEEYANAIKFVTYKLMGDNTRDAYTKVFPEKAKRLIRCGNENNLDRLALLYNRGKLVVKIFEQTLIPSHILNAPLHQEALNELAKVIRDPHTKGLVKVKACETILQYTKQPDIIESKISIGIEQSETINNLREVTEQLALMYKKSLANGSSNLKEITDMKIIDVQSENNLDA